MEYVKEEIEALFLSKKTKHKINVSDRIMAFIESTYEKALRRVLNFPKTVVTTVVLLLTFFLFLQLESTIFLYQVSFLHIPFLQIL